MSTNIILATIFQRPIKLYFHIINPAGVDISKLSDNEYAVVDVETGEWMQYAIDVPKTGPYIIEVWTAKTESSECTYQFKIGTDLIGEEVNVPVTSSISSFEKTSSI